MMNMYSRPRFSTPTSVPIAPGPSRPGPPLSPNWSTAVGLALMPSLCSMLRSEHVLEAAILYTDQCSDRAGAVEAGAALVAELEHGRRARLDAELMLDAQIGTCSRGRDSLHRPVFRSRRGRRGRGRPCRRTGARPSGSP